MSSRAISLIVAIPVLFLFYGFDINNKIQQSDERISQLWATIEKHYEQRNKQLSMVLQEREGMKSPLLKSQDVFIAVIAARNIPTKPDMLHQQAIFELFIQAQHQLDVVLKALLVEIRKSSIEKQGQRLPAIVQLEQYQQTIKELYIDYAREADDYNLMVSRFPASVFAEMKGYQLKSTLNMHYKADRVNFNNLTVPDSK